MNHVEKMHSIKTYLSRFETYVRISNLNNEFDINRYAEDFIIPLLKITYNWELVNINKEIKNAKALDLIDPKRKLGVQVSSDSSLEKIKTTFQKFTTSEYRKKVKKIYFFFLRPKQKKYSPDVLLKLTQRKFNFQTHTNILDCADIYKRISGLTPEKIEEAEKLLKTQFSDFNLKDNFSFTDYEEFKDKYRQCCLNNYSRLNFFGLSIPKKPREVELYSLFVKPDFSGRLDEFVEQKRIVFEGIQDTKTDFREITKEHLLRLYIHGGKKPQFHYNGFEFKQLFGYSNNIVILGNPGAGKSSLIKYSICKIMENDRTIFKNEDIFYFLPIRIELHRYNRFKNENHGGILDYIIYNLVDEFQLAIEKNKVEYFLKNFPVLFFFDGLDEIFDIQERVNVRNDIENFIENNKIIRSVVTSRYESYEEVQLNKKIFQLIDVEDFDKEKITEYVNKWYEIEEGNEYVRTQEIKSCLQQLKGVNDELKQNPLLLSLILILYRNEQDLPTSKLEIYEGCSQTLVDSRDTKEKKLGIQLKISNKISIFSNLAYWQFSNEIRKKDLKIDYTIVKNFIADHLLKKGEFEEREIAEEAAKEFLEFAKTRSIYFENKFTHKTFYEYFIAYYIYTNYYSKPFNRTDLEDIIITNIGVASWHVVLELLICKIDQNQIDFDVIDLIVEKLLKEKPEETSYFFSNLLKHLRNISPAKYRLLLENIIANLINPGKSDSLILKTYFDNLSTLLKIRKYKDAFTRIIETKLLERNLNTENLCNLLYELYNVTNIKEIGTIIEEKTFEISDPKIKAKIFLLKVFDNLSDKTKTLKQLEIFHTQFGNEMTGITYQSDYGQLLFDTNYSFNWVAHLLNQSESTQELDSLSVKLNNLGLTSTIIQKIIKENYKLFAPVLQKLLSEKSLNKKVSPNNTLLKFLFEPITKDFSEIRIKYDSDLN